MGIKRHGHGLLTQMRSPRRKERGWVDDRRRRPTGRGERRRDKVHHPTTTSSSSSFLVLSLSSEKGTNPIHLEITGLELSP